ncbi:hypothetical protein UlMin_014625 [Ulmus minor]
MSNQNVLVLPYPAQGHVKPLMLFSHKLAQNGFKITFVNSDFNHKRVLNARVDDQMDSKIDLVSIPDGLGPEDDRDEIGQLCKAILETMPAKLEELIQNINDESDENSKITCVLADAHMGWAMEVAEKMGIRRAVIWPASAAVFLLELSIPTMILDGILESDGPPTKKQMFQLTAGMPAMDTENIPWAIGDLSSQKIIFHYVMTFVRGWKLTDWWLCNTFYDIESPALASVPKLLPIGPILTENQTLDGHSGSQLWLEDSSCLSWLSEQPPCSVIYVAFGSLTVHDQTQFNELALGLQLIGRPFLWVVRPGFTKGSSKSEYPDGFGGNLGKIVSWAPQQKVLSHPSVACFVSHCGWNSTIEGLSNGVPFLCWPYFADQILNKSYICDYWKVGIGFDADEKGIVSREEVKKKVDQVIGDGDIRRRSLKFKEMAKKNGAEDGQSSRNLKDFITWLKS